MAQELGRISRPNVDQYQGLRKLLLVPLLYGPSTEDEAGAVALQKYWDQMQEQVSALQSALGGLHRVYHESLTEGGPEGLQQLEGRDQRSHSFIQAKCQAGATLEATESAEFLMETLDLQRCLMIPLSSEKVAVQLHDWFTKSNLERYQYIAQQIDQTLGEDETGVLLISERHQVQFPSDIEVFYVSPPALDEFRRWLQNWVAQQQKAMSQEQGEQSVPDPSSGETA
ncbi:MAG: hypothetical protein BZY88_10555 [SAR202 cluster bacterium Io17-Chloro-G9]|nr:MAG: hypothetical protein BZY88_10555 [SAR202 cluster bacterium Io17-Chloro-G9]